MRPVDKGTKGEFAMRVGHEHLASQFKDPLLPPVLATPVMIMMMENAALNAIRPFLEPGESAVGTVVNVQHLAATPVGQMVRAEAEVTESDGRRVAFTVTARDEREEIGMGTHERMVINLKRFDARLAAKAAPRPA
jgi:fluoroacetyl-CoA thioesterase